MPAQDVVKEEQVVEVDVLRDRTFSLVLLASQVEDRGMTVVIKRYGQVIAVVISPADFELLCQVKDSDHSMFGGTD